MQEDLGVLEICIYIYIRLGFPRIRGPYNKEYLGLYIGGFRAEGSWLRV